MTVGRGMDMGDGFGKREYDALEFWRGREPRVLALTRPVRGPSEGTTEDRLSGTTTFGTDLVCLCLGEGWGGGTSL